jgi:hypothetical protein
MQCNFLWEAYPKVSKKDISSSKFFLAEHLIALVETACDSFGFGSSLKSIPTIPADQSRVSSRENC